MRKLIKRIDQLSAWHTEAEAQRVIDWYLKLLAVDPRVPDPEADSSDSDSGYVYVLSFGMVEFWFTETVQWRFAYFTGDVIGFKHAAWLINNA